MTQRELAAKLEREPSFIARLELGERRLDVVEFYWVCKALGRDPAAAAGEVMRELQSLDRDRPTWTRRRVKSSRSGRRA